MSKRKIPKGIQLFRNCDSSSVSFSPTGGGKAKCNQTKEKLKGVKTKSYRERFDKEYLRKKK